LQVQLIGAPEHRLNERHHVGDAVWVALALTDTKRLVFDHVNASLNC
jgi:hypothetical protein